MEDVLPDSGRLFLSLQTMEKGTELGCRREVVCQIAEGEGGGEARKTRQKTFWFKQQDWKHTGCVTWDRSAEVGFKAWNPGASGRL